MFVDSCNLLIKYLNNNFRGWDLFDGLNSKILKSSPFYKLEIVRLVFIQLFKRLPINLRKIAQVPEDYNSKGLGLFASGLVYSSKLDEAEVLLAKLQKMNCKDYIERCWGYNFDWQARAFYVPAGKPNIVTTVFVVDAYLDYLERTGSDKRFNCMGVAVSACLFILKHLVLFEDEEKICFGYIPGEKARVHNANMLGAALLARVYSLTGDIIFFEKSKKAMNYSILALKVDGSWPYGELHHHQFVDNFHTGFNLVALKNWMIYTNDSCFEDQLRNAYQYFLNTFWLDNGCPKYYKNSLYPIDIHCSAQGIITCLKLAEYDKKSIFIAKKIAEWAILNMQDKNGFFYYQKTRMFTNKIPYIRWSQAWMFYALSIMLNDDLIKSCDAQPLAQT